MELSLTLKKKVTMRLMKIFFLNENLDKALDLLAHFIYGIYHIWYVLHESCTSLRMFLRAISSLREYFVISG